MDENKILERLASALGPEAEKIFKEKRREEKLLESFSKALGVVEEKPAITVEPEPQQNSVELVEEIVQPLVEMGRQPEPELPIDDVVNDTVDFLSKVPQKNIQQAADFIPDSFRKELDIIKKSIADFHRFAQRHSQLGGGGAGSVLDIDRPTTLITSNFYAGTRKDYYIGVNYDGEVTIVLPVGVNGKEVIVKDESGQAKKNHITINAALDQTIDNNTTAIIGINNGSLKFLYRDGWRII